MDAELKSRWVEALRSGEYKQGQELLRDDDNTYCCLGVLCEVAEQVEWDGNNYRFPSRELSGYLLPLKYQATIGLTEGECGILIDMNDGRGCTFSEIADFIEENL